MTSEVDAITDQDALDLLDRLSVFGQRIVVVRNRDRETVYVSENAMALTGWTAEEFGQNLYSIIHDADLPSVLAASRALRVEGASEQRVIVRGARKDGRPIEFEVHAENHFDKPPIDGLVVVLTPFSSSVNPSDRWTALLSLTSELIVIQRIDAPAPTFVSPSCEAILGCPADALIDAWRDVIHPDDVQAVLDTGDAIMATPGSETRMRTRVRHADGRWLTLDTTFANHLDDPLIAGLLLRARDITELVEQEIALAEAASRFEAIVTNGPGSVVVIDAEAMITFCSAGVTRLLGHEAEDLIGTSSFELVHPEDVDLAHSELGRILAGASLVDPTVRLRRADGHYEWIAITATNQISNPALRAIVLSLRNHSGEAQAEERMRRLLRDASGATFVLSPDNEVTWATPGIERFIGDLGGINADRLSALVADDDIASVLEHYREVVRGGPGTTARFLCRVGLGSDRPWVDITVTNAKDDPTVGGLIVNFHEVDDAVRAGEAGNRLTEVLENTTDYVSIFDAELNLIWRNPAAAAVFGPAPAAVAEVLAQAPRATRMTMTRSILPDLDSSGSWRGELELRRTDGALTPLEATILVHDSTGGDRFFSMMGRDITDRKRLESRLEARARHDQLTGLPNRLFLSERLETMLAVQRRLALLFIDLDQFKAVNDSQGHDAGDRLLVTASERLRNALRPSDVVARFGGDEFVILLPDIDSVDAAVPLAERVLDHLRGPVQLGPMPLYLTGSAGIALSGDVDATTLISNADAAMYKAKGEGRDRVAVFTDELRARSLQRLETAHLLRSALENQELDVWFQPIVATSTGRPIGVEALVRWRHEELGSIPTYHLIEVAEETGLIHALGTAVLSTTCATIAALGDDARGLTFSVNLSAHQLADPLLIEALDDALKRHRVDPQQLFCEVTESAVMVDVADSARVLDQIRALGVGIAIDDFGTGYSSLAYLQRFAVDVLKIDREFVTGLTLASDWKRSLAGAVISLGHSLGLRVVAEGVEDREQAEILRILGCNGMQGYLFSEAVPASDLPAVLSRLRQVRPEHD